MNLSDKDRERLIRSFSGHGELEGTQEFLLRLLDTERAKAVSIWADGYHTAEEEKQMKNPYI